MPRWFLPFWSLPLVFLTGFAEPDFHPIQVTSLGSNEYKVSIRTYIRARPEIVWQTLTDYDAHAKWLPFMTMSRVVWRDPNALFIEQEGQVRVLLKTYSIRVKQQIWEAPPLRVRFHAVEGDFQKLDGLWKILPAGSDEAVLYGWFTMEPRRHAPGWAVRFVARHYLAAMMQRLRDQAEARGRERHG